MRKILVLPGGGKKGYIQLSVLAAMEYKYGPLHEYFDLIVATSVGSINGAIIASGKISCREYLPEYVDVCEKTFVKNYIKRTPFIRPIYSREPIISAIEKYCGKMSMAETKTKFMSTALSWVDKRTHFFKSWEHVDGTEVLSDVVSRSFAAPYYFGKVVDSKNSQVWGDGGVGQNNTPLDFAYVEAIRQEWLGSVDFYLVGTGYSTESESFSSAKSMGTVSELLNYFDFADGGLARYQSHFQQIQKMQIITNGNPNIRFFNIDCELPESLNVMDYSDLSKYDPYIKIMLEELKRIDR
jgi:predicted patatin/cPLA2 family phospholipase